tara:strand:- start:83 stop:427 length:345 start_codon:yes stop_codon:yes gene_type:complete
MSMRGAMVYRATVERDTETGTDSYGNPLPPSWGSHITLPCRVYNDGKTMIVDGGKTATVEVLRMSFPLDKDVTEDDRITAITDRKGTSLYSGNFEIKEKTRKYTHFEADLKVAE